MARDQDHQTPPDLAEDVLALASSLITDDTRGTNLRLGGGDHHWRLAE